jgi:RecA-family ATPase
MKTGGQLDNSIIKTVDAIVRNHPDITADNVRQISESIVARYDLGVIKPHSALDGVRDHKHLKEQYFEFSGYHTGIDSLDELFLGIKPSDTILVGAEPGLGKSTFVSYLAIQLAAQGLQTLYINLEESLRDFYIRMAIQHEALGYGDEVLNNLYDYSEDSALPLTQSANIVAALYSLSEIGYKVVVIDLINNLFDTNSSDDKKRYRDFIASSRAFCTSTGTILILVSHTRQPESPKERFAPSKYMFFGGNDHIQAATKAFMLAPIPSELDKRALFVLKCRGGAPGYEGKKIILKLNGLSFEDYGASDVSSAVSTPFGKQAH